LVSDPFLVGVFFGFVPAMGFLYILLHRYEGLFSERGAFFAFFTGLGGGLVVTLLQLFISARGAGQLVLVILLFGVLDALVFAAFLNRRRYRGKRDTPFYGVAFGLGFGALNVLFLVGHVVVRLAAVTDIVVETLGLVLVGLYFIGSILVQASVGSWIGRGAAQGELLGECIKTALVEAAYLGGFYLLFVPTVSNLVPFIGLGLAIALIAYILRAVLDPLVPEAIRREMGVHRRRLARQRMLEGSSTRPSGTDPDEARTGGSPSEAPPPRAPPSS
jgi:hypothetical protein